MGGGYIGMECAAGLALNGLDVTVVFPEDRWGPPAWPWPRGNALLSRDMPALRIIWRMTWRPAGHCTLQTGLRG